ncbi:MAG TPA: amino acid adenylation domain-containing protein [Thermoleophilaceae bacterium]|jgi:amino acid adenylation domain-containing protein
MAPPDGETHTTRRAATAAQHEVWLAAQREPESGRYNIPLDLEFEGPVDVAALRAALGDLLARHPALRSSFSARRGTLEQLVARKPPFPFGTDRRPDAYHRDAALSWAAEAAARPLDLTTPPPLRADLLVHPDGALLVVTVHHIVADGWSMEVVARHIAEAYRARLAGAAPALGVGQAAPPVELEADASYWLRLLSGDWRQFAPIPDFVRPAGPGPPADSETNLPPEAYRALMEVAATRRVTPAAVVLTGWALLLHAVTGEDDGVLAMPFHGRPDGAGHDEVDQYARLLPIRSTFGRDEPFSELLGRLADQVLDSGEHSLVPVQRLRQIRGEDGLSAFPPRVVYGHVVAAGESWQVEDTTIRVVEHHVSSAKHELAVTAIERPGGLRIRIDYDAAVFRAETAELRLHQLVRLVTAAAARPDESCIDLLAALAPRPRVGAMDDPGAEPGPTTVSALVLSHAARRPGAVAVRSGDQVVTYGELVERAAALAQWLHSRAVGSGAIVALLLPPGADAVTAMLATALAGAAYLPLDPAYPDAQLEGIVADAAPRLVLTGSEDADRIRTPDVVAHPLADALASASELPTEPPVGADPDTPLNVLYTSGSTGRPKGVVLPHRGIARLARRAGFLPLDETDVVSQLSPLNFDGATYEIWGALMHGAELVVLPRELALDPRRLRDALRRHAVTTLLVTTPLLNRIVDEAPDLLHPLRRVYFGGERVSVPHVRRALAWCRPGTLIHSYGPTENSFTSTWHPVESVDERAHTVPIGRPVPGTQAHVVFPGTLIPAPVGAPGELVLGGAGVACGYLGDPEQTAERFVPDPFSRAAGARLYRTGDRARWTPAAELEFVGRDDKQVKVRSQRVELGEVEAALNALPSVVSSFVTARSNARDETEIVAYAVLSGGARLEDIRAELRAALPSFAVPSHLVALPELPLRPNGKVDRERLPAPHGSPAAPATVDLEDGLAVVHAAWCEVLELPPPTPDTNFFDAGGHSLQLVELQGALERRTGSELPIADLLRHTTVRAQAALIDAAPPSLPRRAGSPEPDDAIAVIGMACRFAGSPTLGAFWENLREGRDCISTGTPLVTPLKDGARRIARWGTLPDGETFDAEFLGLSEAEADALDPQHGIFYECLWAAVEDAGLRISDIAAQTSLYAGRPRFTTKSPSHEPAWGVRADDVVGSDATFMNSRFSYWHDLCGESVFVDTACSTSLVATHLACSSLLGGSSAYALAGGVSLDESSASGSYLYVPGYLYSEDGYCRPFDRDASGTVGGDGAGVVVLRRLSDAVRDGDPIYAVIRGSAINNDGRARIGYSAPGVEGQTRVLRKALDAAGVRGDAVRYVEAHGTGTRLGDTIEATALTDALGWEGPEVVVGGVKASIGHTNSAAGVAGLIKTVLAVYNGYIPATPNVRNPIGELTRLGDRFALVPEGRPWPANGARRTAGVSSFGVGGANAHVVVQEHPAPRDAAPA